MKIKNHTPSHKVKNSKYLLSSTIEYIKNDLKDEFNNNDVMLLKKPKKNTSKTKKSKKKNFLNSKIPDVNINGEKIYHKQSKS